jgi:hypothetical protein
VLSVAGITAWLVRRRPAGCRLRVDRTLPMSRSILLPTILLGALAVMVCWPALARDRHALPPGRQVIEVARPPHSGSYIINGAYFTAKSAACSSWNSGDRITLLAGDWHGHCIDAVFRNAAHRSACQMWCGSMW